MSEGTFTPNYGLSEFTRKAVKEAGVGGEAADKARRHLEKAKTLGKISGNLDQVGKAADEMIGRIKANNAAKEEAVEAQGLLAPGRGKALEDRVGLGYSEPKDNTLAGRVSLLDSDKEYMDAALGANEALRNAGVDDDDNAFVEKPLAEMPYGSQERINYYKRKGWAFDKTTHPEGSPTKFLSQEIPAFTEDDVNWRDGFLEMSDRQSWASPSMYQQFDGIERREKQKHLAAVQSGDKSTAAKVLADQSGRANTLKDFQQTMTTAMQIDKDHGWNVIIEGDDDEAKSNREILGALAANNGKAKAAIDPESGELGFTLGEIDPATGQPMPEEMDPITGQPIGIPKVWMHREIDELISIGTRPVPREESFQNGVMEAQALGSAGGEFDVDGRNKINKNKIKEELIKYPKVARSILHDIWAGGETTLAEDVMTGNVIQGMGFKIKMPKSFGTWTRPLPGGPAINSLDVDGDGYLTAADLTQGDVVNILQELEKREHYKLLAEIAGDWMTRKEQNVHAPAKANYDAEQERLAKTQTTGILD